MLDVCRERAEAAGVAELLDLRLGDLREPPVTERVPLVICPFRAFLHLENDDERLRALRRRLRAARPRRAARLRRLHSRCDDGSRRRTAAGSSASRASSSAPTGTRGAHADADRPRARGGVDDVPRLDLAARVARAARGDGLRGRGAATAGSTAAPTTAARTRSGSPAALSQGTPWSSHSSVWIIIGVVVVVLAVRARRALQRARPQAQPRRERVGAGRRAAEAAARPDPEPRRDGEGLRGARARDVRRGDAGAHARPSRRRGRRSRAQAENVAHRRRSAGSSPSPRPTRSCARPRTSSSSRRSCRETESKIAVSRQVYNDTVLTYDNALQTVPTSIIAGDVQLQAAKSTSRSRSRRPARRPQVALLRRPRSAPAPRAAGRGSRSLVPPRGRSEVVRPAASADVQARQVQPGRLAASSREIDHLLLLRPVHRRLPRHPAPRRASAIDQVCVSRTATGPTARARTTELGSCRPAGHVRRRARHPAASADRLALLRDRRAADVHDQLPASAALAVAYDDVVDVEPQGLGRRVEGRRSTG